MGADPNTGRLHELTDEFRRLRPETESWTKFHVGELVSIKGVQFRIAYLADDTILLRTDAVYARSGDKP